MIIKIDAVKVSQELALHHVVTLVGEIFSVSRDQLKEIIEGTEIAYLVSKFPARISYEQIRDIYQDYYDYYFKLLTNTQYEE